MRAPDRPVHSGCFLVAGCGGIVAAPTLDPVERAVRSRDQIGARAAVRREGGHPDLCRDGHRTTLLAHERPVSKGLQDPFRDDARLRLIRLRQDHRKFVAPVARGDI